MLVKMGKHERAINAFKCSLRYLRLIAVYAKRPLMRNVIFRYQHPAVPSDCNSLVKDDWLNPKRTTPPNVFCMPEFPLARTSVRALSTEVLDGNIIVSATNRVFSLLGNSKSESMAIQDTHQDNVNRMSIGGNTIWENLREEEGADDQNSLDAVHFEGAEGLVESEGMSEGEGNEVNRSASIVGDVNVSSDGSDEWQTCYSDDMDVDDDYVENDYESVDESNLEESYEGNGSFERVGSWDGSFIGNGSVEGENPSPAQLDAMYQEFEAENLVSDDDEDDDDDDDLRALERGIDAPGEINAYDDEDSVEWEESSDGEEYTNVYNLFT